MDATNRLQREKNRPEQKVRMEHAHILKHPEASDCDVTPVFPLVLCHTQEDQEGPTRQTGSEDRTGSYYNHSRSRVNNVPVTSGYYSSLSEDDYLDSNYVTGYEEQDPSSPEKPPFHSQPTGPPHAGLLSIKPANKRSDNSM